MISKSLDDKLLASLKRHNPSRVRAYAGDDDARDIAVPTRRRRWSQVIEAIEARSWSRVELLDKAGAVLGYVENVEPPRELEDLTGVDTASAREIRAAERIVALVMKGQRDVLSFRDAEVTALLKAQGDVVREMTGAMVSLRDLYREQADVGLQLGEQRAIAAAGPDKGQLGELLEAAPALLQALPYLRAMLSGNAPPEVSTPPKPRNGA